jgi:hypothetical protein
MPKNTVEHHSMTNTDQRTVASADVFSFAEGMFAGVNFVRDRKGLGSAKNKRSSSFRRQLSLFDSAPESASLCLTYINDWGG